LLGRPDSYGDAAVVADPRHRFNGRRATS
jgi:hypothetical protein